MIMSDMSDNTWGNSVSSLTAFTLLVEDPHWLFIFLTITKCNPAKFDMLSLYVWLNNNQLTNQLLF